MITFLTKYQYLNSKNNVFTQYKKKKTYKYATNKINLPFVNIMITLTDLFVIILPKTIN